MTDSVAGGLDRIEHIVVLMLENRSFDHMLGYLSLEGGREDVDGLRPGMANHFEGQSYPIRHLGETGLPNEHWDLDHSGAATDVQIKGGEMDGFVASYAAKLARESVADPDPGIAMGYFNAGDLPVYDHLARHFCVCDRWHSSVAGATWPNRLYALAGSAAGSRDDRKPPLYDKHSFIRHLDTAGVSWRSYSYDIGSLRCVDQEYRLGHHEHFAYVQKLKLALTPRAEQEVLIDEDSASFLEDAARGRLPAVSWIDPNFKDFNLIGSPPNDDHPPSDVEHGQELVLLVYNALAASPQWEKTMMIVLYDEHGGFFDHVAPPEHPPDDDPQTFSRYGIRVPALIASPWVAPGKVSHTLFDHTAIAKTVLQRFCPAELQQRGGADALFHWLDHGHPHYMGKRVAMANDLGELLELDRPRAAPDRSDLIEWAAKRRSDHMRRLLSEPAGMLQPAEEHSATDLQTGMLQVEQHLRHEWHPAGQP